ncbi:MAG: rod shape-determining protein MreD, partial [Acidimicrobiia bacterium]
MRLRVVAGALGALLVAVIIQTTLISRFRFVTPDLVLLLSILFALTSMRREGVLLMAFLGGLVIDLLSSTPLGLRAAVF